MWMRVFTLFQIFWSCWSYTSYNVFASHVSFTFWPRNIGGKVKNSPFSQGKLVIQSNAGLLGVIESEDTVSTKTRLHSLIDSIEIMIVPTDISLDSNVFTQYLESLQFTCASSSGVKFRVKYSKSVESPTKELPTIKSNVFHFAKELFPAILYDQSDSNWLAFAPFDFDHLEEETSTLDFATSTKNFPWNILVSSLPPVSFSLVDSLKRNGIPLFSSQDITSTWTQRLLTLKIQQLKESKNVSVVWKEYILTKGSKSILELAQLDPIKDEVNIAQEVTMDRRNFLSIQMIQPLLNKSFSSFLIQQPSSSLLLSNVEATATVKGEGFHRIFSLSLTLKDVIEAKLLNLKAESIIELLLVVTLPTTAYVDLDELRRLERFGSLKLLSFSKHIDIEKPSGISTQHSIGLIYKTHLSTNVNTKETTVEFPIHLRYQQPSETILFRGVHLIVPEIRVKVIDQITEKQQQLNNDPQLIQILTKKKGLLLNNLLDPFKDTSPPVWKRVHLKFPIQVSSVSPLEIPVGFLPHGTFVSSVTLFVTSLGAIVLILTAFQKQNEQQKQQHTNIKSLTTKKKTN